MQDYLALYAGGLMAMAGGLVGFAMGAVKGLPHRVYNFCMTRFTVVVTVHGTDDVFRWVQMWLAKAAPNARNIRMLTRYPSRKGGYKSYDDNDDGPAIAPTKGDGKRPLIVFAPGHGNHVIRYEGCWVSVAVSTKENKDGNLTESMTIRSRRRDTIEKMAVEARDMCVPLSSEVNVMMPVGRNDSTRWRTVEVLKPRDMSSVITDASANVDGMLEDFAKFKAADEWYTAMGLPYHRGYLLFGPPGSGKTSLVNAVAGKFAMDLFVLNLANRMIDDNGLRELLSKAPESGLVVLEDVDCAFASREDEEKGKDSVNRITLSGLLNAIDGLASKHGRIMIMTTNYLERLDPALVRPGRVDFRVHLDNATQDQAARLFKRFFPDHTGVDAFAATVPDRKISMAAIQNHLLVNKETPDKAISTMPDYVASLTTPKSSTVEEATV